MASRELPVSVALAAVSAAVALNFGALVTSNAYIGPVLGAALLPHALGWVTRRWTRSGIWGALVSLFGLCVYASALEGSPSRIPDRIQAGWTSVRIDTTPLRANEAIVLLMVLVVWVVASVADDLTFRRDASISALFPALVAFIFVRLSGLSRLWVPDTIFFGVAAAAFLAVQHQALIAHGRTRVGRSSGPVAPMLLLAAIAMGLVAILVGGGIASAVLGGYPHGRLAHTRSTGGDYHVSPYVAIGGRLQRGNHQVLFTVKANQPAYWRVTALDQYSSTGGGQWTLTANTNGVGTGLSGSAPAGALHQTYQVGALGARWMPAAYDPVSVTRPDTLVVLDSDTLATRRSTVSGLRYSVVSNVGPRTITAALRLGTAAPIPKSLGRFTQLPSDIPALVTETAQGVTAGRTLPYDRAAALRDYFRSGLFTYDPTVNLGDDENAMNRFLTERRGFCVQFASTFAVMARSLGIPARVAVGFTPGTRDAKGVYHVINDEAHAWPEIYLSGIGWTDLFDPTPASGQPGASGLPSEPPSPPPAPTTKTTQPTPTTVAPPATSPSGSSSGGSSSGSSSTPRQRATISAPSGGSGGGLSSLTLVGLLVGLVVFGGLATFVVASTRKARRRARRRDASLSAEQVAGAWAEALDGLADAGVAWPASLTPLEVAGRLPGPVGPEVAPPLQSLAGRYTAARYGPAPPDPTAVDAAWRDADEVHRKLVATLRVSDRVRARLRVRGAPRQPEPAGWSGLRSPSTKD
jgi:transglutaminase-like putative cysteine protease/type II secretory pathway pseudopilin PulG